MIALIQRVRRAKVEVNGNIIARIDQGILAFIGMQKNDQPLQADKLLHKLLNYRIFADDNDKMNLSVNDIQGGLLLVPQFTLAADTKKGTRPSFAPAAPPELGKQLFNHFLQQAEDKLGRLQSGQFGADMQVSLINNGPVSFWLQC